MTCRPPSAVVGEPESTGMKIAELFDANDSAKSGSLTRSNVVGNDFRHVVPADWHRGPLTRPLAARGGRSRKRLWLSGRGSAPIWFRRRRNVARRFGVTFRVRPVPALTSLTIVDDGVLALPGGMGARLTTASGVDLIAGDQLIRPQLTAIRTASSTATTAARARLMDAGATTFSSPAGADRSSGPHGTRRFVVGVDGYAREFPPIVFWADHAHSVCNCYIVAPVPRTMIFNGYFDDLCEVGDVRCILPSFEQRLNIAVRIVAFEGSERFPERANRAKGGSPSSPRLVATTWHRAGGALRPSGARSSMARRSCAKNDAIADTGRPRPVATKSSPSGNRWISPVVGTARPEHREIRKMSHHGTASQRMGPPQQ